MSDIDVCVCTFRRTSLAATLRSVAAQVVPAGIRIRVIVVDNDASPSARDLTHAVCNETGLVFRYIHGPAHNISIARNHCLANADARLVAFLDDDETAAPVWLSALIETMQRTGADIVFGPVMARYPAAAASWLRRADLHSIAPVIRPDGEIRTGYTSNVLLRGDVLRASPPARFLEELGRSGGEDTVFFQTLYETGARLAFSKEAVVFEDVPPHRQLFAYLLSRAFRMGQTHARVQLRLEHHPIGRNHPSDEDGCQNEELEHRQRGERTQNAPARSRSRLARHQLLALALLKCMTCSLLTLACCASAPAWRRQFYRAAMHAGVIAKLCGMADVRQY